MMEVGPFEDVEWMNSLCRDESIYPCLGDDSSPPKEDFSVEVFNAVPHRFLDVVEDGERIGFFVFIEMQAESRIWEQHTILSEKCRGRKAIEAGKLALWWMEKICGAIGFSSYCASDMPAAQWYAKKLGYEAGEVVSTLTRHGKPVDVIAFSRQPRTNLCPS